MAPGCTATVTVPNRRGLHARASAKFVNLAASFEADIEVSNRTNNAEQEKVCGTSIMGLMMLAAATGHELVIEAQGPQAKEAVDALCALVASGFDED